LQTQPRFGDDTRSSSMTWCSTGSSGLLASRSRVKPPASEIKHVVNQLGHTHDGRLHHRHNLMLSFRLRTPPEDARASADGGERIAEVVAEDSDKLFPELRSLALRLKAGFGGFARLQKLLLVAAAIRRLQYREACEERLARSVAAFQGVAYHLDRLAFCRYHLNRKLIEEALHAQERRDMIS
jgi:hypothetical protein